MQAANTALTDLYQTYSSELHGFARRRVCRQKVEDIVQDTHLHMLQRGTAATLEHPRPYLYQIAANLAVDFLRKTKARLRHLSEETELSCNPEGPPGPEARGGATLELKRLEAALAELPRGVFIQSRQGPKPRRDRPEVRGLGAHDRPPHGQGLGPSARGTRPEIGKASLD